MVEKKIHFKVLGKQRSYCGTIAYGFTEVFVVNWTMRWQEVTCKSCLKKLFKEKPYLKDMPRRGDIIKIGDSVVTVLESEIVDKTFTVKYMKED